MTREQLLKLGNEVKNRINNKEEEQMEALYQFHDCKAGQDGCCRGCDAWFEYKNKEEEKAPFKSIIL